MVFSYRLWFGFRKRTYKMNNIGKYEKAIAKSMLKKLLSLNLIDENEFRILANNINLDIEKKLCGMHS